MKKRDSEIETLIIDSIYQPRYKLKNQDLKPIQIQYGSLSRTNNSEENDKTILPIILSGCILPLQTNLNSVLQPKSSKQFLYHGILRVYPNLHS